VTVPDWRTDAEIKDQDEVKSAEGALGQKESVAQVTPNQGGQANQAASK
jgi:hypothetical protein